MPRENDGFSSFIVNPVREGGLFERRLFQEVADEICINTEELLKDATRTI